MTDLTLTQITSHNVSLDVNHVLIEANALVLRLLAKYEPEAMAMFSGMWKTADDVDRLVLCQSVIRALGAQ